MADALLGENFFSKQFRIRLMGLKEEMDQLLSSLGEKGEVGFKRLDINCGDYGVMAQAPFGPLVVAKL